MPVLRNVPLVGRDGELDRLDELFTTAGGPRTVVVTIEGEAGIGKSFVVRTFLERVARRGAIVINGRAESAERGIPFGVLDHALATFPLRGPDIDALVGAVRAAVVARTDDPGGRHVNARVFGATSRLLDALHDEGPLVVALDDLPSADEGSVTVLAALARRFGGRRLMVVTTRRPDVIPSLAEQTFARMTDEVDAHVLQLGPLGRDSLDDLIHRLTGYPPDEALTQVVLERAGGNPFITEELLDALREADALLLSDHGLLKIRHADIRLAPRRRLARRVLPDGEASLRLARVLAVAADFHVSELTAAARVARLDEDDADRAFDALIRARLIVVRADGGYEFRHRILQETLHAELGPAERRRLHADLSSALLALRDDDRTIPSARVAVHAVAAADGCDERAAALAQAAGDELINVAPASAAVWYRQAVELSAPASRERPVRLARLARGHLRSDALVDAVDRGLDALAHLEDGVERVRCAADTVEALLRCGAGRRALDLLDVELARGIPHTRLLVLRITALAFLQQYDEATVVARAATESAARGSTDHLLALSASAALADQLGDMARVKQLIDEQVTLAPSLPARSQQFVYGFAALLLASEWRVDDALPLLARAQEVAGQDEALGDDRITIAAMEIASHQGDWDAALDHAARCRAGLTEDGPSVHLVQTQIVEARILASRGDVATARRRMARDYPDLVPCWLMAQCYTRAWIELLDHRLEAARDLLESGLGTGTAGAPATLIVHALMATTMHRLGDAAAANRFLAVAESGLAPESPPYVSINVLMARGEVLGNADAARAAYEVASRHGLRFERALTQVLRGQLGDDPQEQLTSAWREFRELGATVWREQVVTALRERDLPIPRTRRRDPFALSETEQQIMRLIADGLRNREIAQRLSYSQYTVETYISRIYAKTGATSRTGLSRLLDADPR